MSQRLAALKPSTLAQEQLQEIMIQLAEIEQRLLQVDAAVALLAKELAMPPAVTEVVVTPEDEARVRAALVKPRSLAVVRLLARADKQAERFKRLPKKERQALLAKSLEQAQADAVARGISLDSEREAARGD
jgi:hypothetical protein